MSAFISPRVWGRVYAVPFTGAYVWQVVTPDENGHPDYVYITNLIQVLKLNLGESPFYANFGIPAQRSVVQQVFPDFYVNMTQQQFAQYFASLTIAKIPSASPMYRVNLTTMQGTTVAMDIPV